MMLWYGNLLFRLRFLVLFLTLTIVFAVGSQVVHIGAPEGLPQLLPADSNFERIRVVQTAINVKGYLGGSAAGGGDSGTAGTSGNITFSEYNGVRTASSSFFPSVSSFLALYDPQLCTVPISLTGPALQTLQSGRCNSVADCAPFPYLLPYTGPGGYVIAALPPEPMGVPNITCRTNSLSGGLDLTLQYPGTALPAYQVAALTQIPPKYWIAVNSEAMITGDVNLHIEPGLLRANQQYLFRIGAGGFPPSLPSLISSNLCSPTALIPLSVAGLSVTALSTSTVRVQWTLPANFDGGMDLTGIEIIVNGGTEITLIGPTPATMWSKTNALPQTQYIVQVRGRNGLGPGTSSQMTVTTPPLPPDPPVFVPISGRRLLALPETKLSHSRRLLAPDPNCYPASAYPYPTQQLSWNPPNLNDNTGITGGYQVRILVASSGGFTCPQNIWLAYDDQSLNPVPSCTINVVYNVMLSAQVRVKNSQVWSNWSSVVALPVQYYVPEIPPNLRIAFQDANGITIAWDAPKNNDVSPMSYTLLEQGNPIAGGSNVMVSLLPVQGPTSFAVQACNSIGCSLLSNSLPAARYVGPTPAPSPAPTNRPTTAQPSTRAPTSAAPSRAPSTQAPTTSPSIPVNTPSTNRPSFSPTTAEPTLAPTFASAQPTHFPTQQPTPFPTPQPTHFPTQQPSFPTRQPTSFPTQKPTRFPTQQPTMSLAPSPAAPTNAPTTESPSSPPTMPTPEPPSPGGTLAVSLQASMEVIVTYGVASLDTSTKIVGDRISLGTPVLYAGFDPSFPASQIFLRDLCFKLINNSNLVIRSFEEGTRCMFWQFAQGQATFPILDRNEFYAAFISFLRENPGYRYDVGFAGSSSNVTFVSVRALTRVANSIGSAAMEEVYAHWQTAMNELNTAAPLTVGAGYATADPWPQMAVENHFIESTKEAIIISLAICFAALAIFTENVYLAMYTTCFLMLECFFMLGMFGALRWTLGAVEAVSLSIIIGLSVDYFLHTAHWYSRTFSKTRKQKTLEMLSKIGFSILSAAAVAILACGVLYFCYLHVFSRVGSIISITILAAVCLSLISLTALLFIVGPQYQNGWVGKACRPLNKDSRHKNITINAVLQLQILSTHSDRRRDNQANENDENKYDQNHDEKNLHIELQPLDSRSPSFLPSVPHEDSVHVNSAYVAPDFLDFGGMQIEG